MEVTSAKISPLLDSSIGPALKEKKKVTTSPMMQPDKHIFLDAHASQLLTFSLSQVQDDITVMTSSG